MKGGVFVTDPIIFLNFLLILGTPNLQKIVIFSIGIYGVNRYLIRNSLKHIHIMFSWEKHKTINTCTQKRFEGIVHYK